MTDTKGTVRVAQRFATSAGQVFDAWLDPATAGQWLFATPGGQMRRVEIDARPGGRFIIVERRAGADAEHIGEFLEIDRPRRLVFLFMVEAAFAATRVTVDIIPSGEGCELTLTHEGVADDYLERTRSGWTGILDGLAKRLGEGG